MKKIAIIGSGMMTKPIADYFLDICHYEIIMADLDKEKGEKIIGNRNGGRSIELSVKDRHALDALVDEADIIISMVPKHLHLYVLKSCLRFKKNMLTTSYETPDIMELSDEIESKGILVLSEMGEDPGIDHFGTHMILDGIREEGGTVIDLKSYGGGIPSFEHNNNPMGYKFSWDPVTFFVASQTSAAYYNKGSRVEVSGDQLFSHFYLIDIEDLGTFETYPNKDCRKYMKSFRLDKDISYYRGLLRHPGYCNNMRYLSEIGYFDSQVKRNFEGVSYRSLTASLIDAKPDSNLEKNIAHHMNMDINSDFIHRLKWLGFLEDEEIEIKKGSLQDILREQMLKKMYYKPHGKDMIILHIEAIAKFPNKKKELRTATMVVKGIPHGDSAISRAVGLPIALGACMILEGKINAIGAHNPTTLPQIYKPLLKGLEKFGFKFSTRSSIIKES